MLIRVVLRPTSGDGRRAPPPAEEDPGRRSLSCSWRAALQSVAAAAVLGLKLVSSAVLLWLCYQELVLYASEPVATDTLWTAAPAPALTVCPLWPAAAVYNASLEELRAGNISSGEFVERLRPDPARLLRPCDGCDVTAEHTVAVRVHHSFQLDDETRMPYCVTAEPPPRSADAAGGERQVALELAVEPVLSRRVTHLLLIHWPDQELTLPESVYRVHETASAEVPLRPGTVVTLQLTMMASETVSRRSAPCGFTSQQRRRSCMQRALAETAGCRADWMASAEVRALPPCPLGSQAALREASYGPEWRQRLVERCRGPSNCRFEQVRLVEEARVTPLLTRPDTVRVHLSWPPMMRETRQRLAVTEGDVAAYVGGLVGLFWGLSAFTVLDAALATLRRLTESQ
ncbi:hypothetical protein FJT64_018984 [Amphibalanus amphitrite]|uniref:Uncharacterized protein n=1 Tax=Amphibalanus amphitrite TaxID=1232801 RepID=A0A6A4X1D7_AMPAM|nr:hypothetical protein FJT64_018984 [Amphibalanus amphitrite]